MTIIKLSKSGKQLQVIDDFGNVYGCSIVSVDKLLKGEIKQAFTMLNRLPFKVAPERFGQSPLWEIPGQEGQCNSEVTSDGLSANNDAFSKNFNDSKKKKEAVKDKMVW